VSLNLYDVLDVEETATPEQIRAAWKSAIADLDPGDRRFRAFNDAAGVLLDADKRAAYDAQLAAQREDEAEPAEPAEESVAEPAAEPMVEPDAEAEDEAEVEAEDEAAPPVAPEPAAVVAEEPAAAAAPRRTSAGPGLVAIGVAAVVAVLATALGIWVLSLPDVKPLGQRNARLASTGDEVEQLVADKIVPALSYDYRTLPADLKQLQAYETPTMASQQAKAWQALTPQAKQQHAVVVSHVPTNAPGTALKRLSDDGTQAVVVAFIDQDVKKLDTAPFTLKQSATFILDKDAKTGSWLVDQICTDRVCG
jgi:Mce-associated membrane protein